MLFRRQGRHTVELSSRDRALFGIWRCRNWVLCRKANFHFQATAVSIAAANAAAMGDCYSLRDRQAQTGSAGLMFASFCNSVERLKDTTQGFGRHAITVVSDEDTRRVRTTAEIQ